MPPRDLSKETLGYVIHTNRELGMMLKGTKPLAVFSELDGNFLDSVRRYFRMFDRRVQAGIFVRRDHIGALPLGTWQGEHDVHEVFFSLPEETWRIDAMIELRKHSRAWNPEHERREGMLLGYTDEQNDIWIATRYGRR